MYLGNYPWAVANDIAGELEAAGIAWWYKQPGFFSQIWEFGVRLFVDRDHLEEAREIARRTQDQSAPRRPPSGDARPGPGGT